MHTDALKPIGTKSPKTVQSRASPFADLQ